MKRSICSRCTRPVKVCYCHTLSAVHNRWPIHILQHPKESKHPIGTARIAELSLSQCILQVGEKFTLESIRNIRSEFNDFVVVYPGEDSMSIESLDPLYTKTLIFLDASWRKSRRMLYESPELMALPKVGIHPKKASHYRIRKAPDTNSLSTLEAIVYTLSVLENNGEVGEFSSLLNSMDWMIEKQIELMGRGVFERNYKSDRF